MATISGENAKNIRQPMDVLIEIKLSDDTVMTINNDNLVQCTLSLRSDLSKWEPTLPESEINIEAFYTADMTDFAATIKEGTPVTYSAGYPGDMSPIRYFYIDEKITWADNILHIHAVDQINLLEGELPPILLGQEWDGTTQRNNSMFKKLYWLIRDIVFPDYYVTDGVPIVDHLTMETEPATDDSYTAGGLYSAIIFSRRTAREFIAMFNSWFHMKMGRNGVNPFDLDYFWPTYIDAGRPKLTWTRPSSIWLINEDECANVKTETERNIVRYIVYNTEVVCSGAKEQPFNVSGSLFYDKGLAPDYSDYVAYATFGLRTNLDDINAFDVVPGANTGTDINRYLPKHTSETESLAWYDANAYGKTLIDSEAADMWFRKSKDSWIDLVWDSTLHNLWDSWVANSLIESDATSTDLDAYCRYYIAKELSPMAVTETSHGVYGDQMELTPPFDGDVYMSCPGSTATTSFNFPFQNVRNVGERSNKTGSFIWKGDPRMQPRDVFTFVRRSYGLLNENGEELTDENGEVLFGGGDSIDCTIENITLTHSGGGLNSEITYREGIC